jgi:hypothetical protein
MFKDRRAEILGWFCRGFGKVRKMKFGNSISTLSGGKFKKLNIEISTRVCLIFVSNYATVCVYFLLIQLSPVCKMIGGFLRYCMGKREL